jgi:hypothetical protein
LAQDDSKELFRITAIIVLCSHSLMICQKHWEAFFGLSHRRNALPRIFGQSEGKAVKQKDFLGFPGFHSDNRKSKIENWLGLSPSLPHSLFVGLWPTRSRQAKSSA